MKDYFRPLKITHEWLGYRPDAPFEDKVKAITARVLQIKDEGYGGIVTNVHCHNYLRDPDEWALMREKVRICRENDMRMWLYDENGYPSGGAGIETVRANIDFEARAAVMPSMLLAPNETWEIELPRGHEKPLSAFAYYISGDKITDNELSQKPLRPQWTDGKFTFTNTSTDKNLLCLAFFQKHMYEGGHCEHNCCAARRYIDISNKDAVKEFINNTYARYAETVGEFFSPAIGDPDENSVIEAIFTDEPSYMGFYINADLIAPHTVDPVDKEIPLYPVILWGKDFTNRFLCLHGYRIENNMPYLYMGNSTKAKKVRRDFYQVATDLLEQNFFAQISDYCASVGLNFSGHIILEEDIHDHVAFEGNFFKLLRHMHYPGIDFLNSLPEKVWQYAFTPLLVSSIAELYGKPHVMDEISAHAQGGVATIQQIYTSVLMQYALGADVFNSYYGEDYPIDDYRRIWEAVSYAQSKTQNKESRSAVIIHYPYETMMHLRKPDQPCLEAEEPSRALISACEKGLRSAMFSLLNTQCPFNFCDTDTLDIAANANPKVFIIPAGIIENALAAKARALNDAPQGCRVIYYCPANEFTDEYAKISAFATLITDEQALAATVNDLLGGPRTTGDTEKVAALWANDAALLVNSEATEKQITLTRLAAKSATEAYTKAPAPLTVNADGTVTVTLAGYAAVVVES